MKLAVIVTALLASSAAFAADMPLKAIAPPLSSGTGFYLGVNGGAGFFHTAVDWLTAVSPGMTGSSSTKIFPGGAMGGATIGWGTSFGAVYAAVEADLDMDFTKGSNTCSSPIAGPIALQSTCGTKNSWMSTQGVILGIPLGAMTGALNSGKVITSPQQWPIPIPVSTTLAASPVMPFVKIGMAERNVQAYVNPVTIGGTTVFPGTSGHETLAAFLIGAGVMIPMAQGWNTRIEIDWADWNKQVQSNQTASGIFGATAFKPANEYLGKVSLTYGF